MTEKQENILMAALKLFAENGFTATSTSKVAKQAGVSEGLIFRHFENKEGLLKAIMQQGAERATHFYANILSESDPKTLIREVIKLPFSSNESDYHFWKLMYALKWQADVYDDTFSKPIRAVLIAAFEKLGYKDPEAETETIMILVDGIATAVLLRKPTKQDAILNSILAKYEL